MNRDRPETRRLDTEQRNSDGTRFGALLRRRVRSDPFAALGFGIVVVLIVIAYLAPLLANDKPLLMRWQGQLYAPAVVELFPLRLFVHYPELIGVDYDAIAANPPGIMVRAPIPYSPLATSLDDKLRGPSRRHWMGTDDLGRDVMSRMIHGTGVSLSVGIVAVAIAVVIGVLVGAVAGYFGGWIDILASRMIEVVMCFPFLFLILAVIAFLPPSIYNIMIVIGITRWTSIARYTRGEFLRSRNQDYTAAARALGAGSRRIIFRHILPNSLTPVFVAATFGIANAILIEAALSFLGLGIPPPAPTWGGILAQAREYIDIAWWLATMPGIAIFLTVTSFNIIGEALRDVSDPRTLPARQ